MGMFDDITCEYPLPDEKAQDLTYQTKDLNNMMDHYIINKEGRLILEYWKWEMTPENEKPYPNAEKGTFAAITGMVRHVPGSRELIDQDYHGDIYMYCGDYEYDVRFTEGTVSRITRIRPERGEGDGR